MSIDVAPMMETLWPSRLQLILDNWQYFTPKERERIAAAVRDATEIARTAIAKSSFDSAEQAIASLARLPESADAVRMVTAGAGGYGAPSERARHHVDADVREGKVSEAIARAIYLRRD